MHLQSGTSFSGRFFSSRQKKASALKENWKISIRFFVSFFSNGLLWKYNCKCRKKIEAEIFARKRSEYFRNSGIFLLLLLLTCSVSSLSWEPMFEQSKYVFHFVLFVQMNLFCARCNCVYCRYQLMMIILFNWNGDKKVIRKIACPIIKICVLSFRLYLFKFCITF